MGSSRAKDTLNWLLCCQGGGGVVGDGQFKS